MTGIALNFNAFNVAPQTALEAVPSGIYNVMITNSEEKKTGKGVKGDGAYLNFDLTIQGGEFNGRKLAARLNIVNDSAVAVEIAYGELSAIAHVTGKFQFQSTAELHGIPFQVVVAKVKRADGNGDGNEIRGYKTINGVDPDKVDKSGAAGATGAATPDWAGQQAAATAAVTTPAVAGPGPAATATPGPGPAAAPVDPYAAWEKAVDGASGKPIRKNPTTLAWEFVPEVVAAVVTPGPGPSVDAAAGGDAVPDWAK